jgi:hypothetical protein
MLTLTRISLPSYLLVDASQRGGGFTTGFVGFLACAHCISKIRGNEIRFATCCANFVDRPHPAFRAASYNQDMGPQPGPVYSAWRDRFRSFLQ